MTGNQVVFTFLLLVAATMFGVGSYSEKDFMTKVPYPIKYVSLSGERNIIVFCLSPATGLELEKSNIVARTHLGQDPKILVTDVAKFKLIRLTGRRGACKDTSSISMYSRKAK